MRRRERRSGIVIKIIVHKFKKKKEGFFKKPESNEIAESSLGSKKKLIGKISQACLNQTFLVAGM